MKRSANSVANFSLWRRMNTTNIWRFQTSAFRHSGKQPAQSAVSLEEEEVGGRQQILMALRDSELNDETRSIHTIAMVIDTYDEAGNYLILLYLDSYDVMTRAKDNINVDESEEVYKYMLCAICPVTLSKPGLGYLEKEQRIGARIRDWDVGAPENRLFIPCLQIGALDIHSTLFYTKNTKEPHSEFMTNGLGCGVERTATEQKMAFHSIVRNVLGAEDESTDDKLLDIQQNLSEMADDYAGLTMMTTIRSFSTARL